MAGQASPWYRIRILSGRKYKDVYIIILLTNGIYISVYNVVMARARAPIFLKVLHRAVQLAQHLASKSFVG